VELFGLLAGRKLAQTKNASASAEEREQPRVDFILS